MQAQALQSYEGYIRDGLVYPVGELPPFKNDRRVYILIPNEPEPTISASDKEKRLARLAKLHQSIENSMDEELNYIPRSAEMRTPIDLSE